MEYVIVRYPDGRAVFVDGKRVGRTNRTLELETGHHRFTLGEPEDYTPGQREVAVTGTDPILPMELVFRPKSPKS